MKKNLLLLLIASLGAQANTYKISHLDQSDHLEVFLNDGQVLEVAPENKELIEKIYQAYELNSSIEIELESGPISPDVVERIESIKFLENDFYSNAMISTDEVVTPLSNFTPTNIENMDLVKEMFNSLKQRTKWFTQCFNRAHIWARQMDKDFGVQSEKILIYYTKKFRKEVSGKWWFHIAPMVTVQGEKYVMDKEFTREPITAKAWEEIFTEKMRIKNIGPKDYRCTPITHMSEYYDETNMNYDFCNIQHTSMYYWEPNDMERLENKGIQKTEWVNWEIKAAAKEAWKKWKEIYDQYKI